MTKLIILLITIFYSFQSKSKDIIYLVDTGVHSKYLEYMCPNGQKSYDGVSNHLHGSQMAKEIVNTISHIKDKFCIVSIDVFDESQNTIHISTMISAFEYLKSQRPGIINLSMAGRLGSIQEKKLLKDLSDLGFKINIASGNEGVDLLYGCISYPACYFRDSYNNIRVISNNSNYSNKNGPVTHVESVPIVSSGTSGSTALHSAKMILTKHAPFKNFVTIKKDKTFIDNLLGGIYE